MGIDPAATDRFREDVAWVAGATPAIDRPLALAVSGGPDSMAMLALAVAAFPGCVVAATVDHGLRAGSADEAAMVAGWCAGADVPHAVLRPAAEWSPRTLQADARHVRYALLADWALAAGALALATAHHADDQAETFLMRAARGSGVAGLAGIRSRWLWERHRWHSGYPEGGAEADVDALPVVRPLLDWRREELAVVCAAAGMQSVRDPSNADDRFDRVRARRWLATQPDLDARALARSAAACAEADAAIAAMMDVLRGERARDSDVYECTYDIAGLPRELCRRLARDAIGYVRDVQGITEGRWSDANNVEPLLEALEAGGQATLAGVLASAKGALWHFRKAPPRRAT